jgi:hypothetical protein
MVRPLPTVHPLRACQLCAYHSATASGLYCEHPIISRQAEPTACVVARHADGLCGIDARLQHWPHLERQLAARLVPVLMPLHPHTAGTAA